MIGLEKNNWFHIPLIEIPEKKIHEVRNANKMPYFYGC